MPAGLRPGPSAGAPDPAPVATPGGHTDAGPSRETPSPAAQDDDREAMGALASERTGDEAVDAVLADVGSLAVDAPLPEQLSRLVDAHAALQRRLTATDS